MLLTARSTTKPLAKTETRSRSVDHGAVCVAKNMWQQYLTLCDREIVRIERLLDNLLGEADVLQTLATATSASAASWRYLHFRPDESDYSSLLTTAIDTRKK